MANGRIELADSIAWNHTAQVLAMLHTSSGRFKEVRSAKDFHPYLKKRTEMDWSALDPEEKVAFRKKLIGL